MADDKKYVTIECDNTLDVEIGATPQQLLPLIETNNSLATSNKTLTATNQTLAETCQEQATTNDGLADTNAQLTATNQTLVNNIDSLVNSNVSLISTNAKLTTANKTLTATNTELSTENTKLVDNNTQLAENNSLLINKLPSKLTQFEYETITFVDGYKPKSWSDFLNNYKEKVQRIVDTTSGQPTSETMFEGMTNLEYVELTGVLRLGVESYKHSFDFYGCTRLKVAKFPNCISYGHGFPNASGAFRGCTSLEEIYVPNAAIVSFWTNIANSLGNLRILDLSSMQTESASTSYTMLGDSGRLIDIRSGKNFTKSMIFMSDWSPSEALLADSISLVNDDEQFTSNREKLLYNLREHLAANLPTLSNNEGYTLTMSTKMKEAIAADEATASAFADKGWTLA